jgi:putative ABC transport system ATP-binding protein
MFRLDDVSKVYSRRGHAVVAFRAASLKIPAGDYLAIVGPSGSGKTTLLSMLGGMLSPDTGQVFLEEASLYEMSVARRTRLRREKFGFVFQTFNLVPYLTAVENVQVPLYLSGLPRKEQRERAVALLERVGLGDRLDHKPHEMSTGQQQRVALARTLANQPPVILADEPTGNLDPESRKRVLDFLDELHQENRTIVMVTHDLAAAERAQRRLTLRDGAVSAILSRKSKKAA